MQEEKNDPKQKSQTTPKQKQTDIGFLSPLYKNKKRKNKKYNPPKKQKQKQKNNKQNQKPTKNEFKHERNFVCLFNLI